MFIGNRGIIHDPTTRTPLSRRWTSTAWLICRCDSKAQRRSPMSRDACTALFFLDEERLWTLSIDPVPDAAGRALRS